MPNQIIFFAAHTHTPPPPQLFGPDYYGIYISQRLIIFNIGYCLGNAYKNNNKQKKSQFF